MIDPNANPVIRATLFRRVVAVVMLLISGGMFLYLAANEPSVGIIWKAVFALLGIGLFVLAAQLRSATTEAIRLTQDGLVETSGRLLCTMDNIDRIETSAFSFKPSNGLLVRLKTPMPGAWAPGLWWRYGTKLGIGGVTSAGEAKAMADIIALRRLYQNS